MAKHIVTGPAAVLTLRGRQGDQYLYTGAIVPENVYTADSVKNAVEAGLLTEVVEEVAEATVEVITAVAPAAEKPKK